MRARRANYHAGRHVGTLLGVCKRVDLLLPVLLELSRQGASRQPSDASVLHVRRTVLHSAITAPCGYGDVQSLLLEELRWTREQLERMPWQEALWNHRQALLCEVASYARLQPLIVDGSLDLSEGEGRPTLDHGSDEQMVVATRFKQRHSQWCTRLVSDPFRLVYDRNQAENASSSDQFLQHTFRITPR
mmetsp:Transcript_20357/g.43680  ORF Transcript_20357/g.43680 Transcript_20357/m.43680 type:complete len:189 (-) Transcript_20357:158-724(-)